MIPGRSHPMHFDFGNGEPVIFVHGIASTHATWGPLMQLLSSHFRCLAYDLRGHGEDRREPALSLEALVEDLEELRRAEQLDKVRLVGHSLGALIVAGHALKYASCVQSLALLAAPAARSEADRQRGAQLIDDMRTRGVQEVLSGLVDSWYSPDFMKSRPELLAGRLDQIRSISDEVLIKAYELYYGIELAPWLERITVPTLVMTGRYARGCGANVAAFIASRLAKPSLVILEDQRNGILTEAPERVSAELLKFFQSD